MTRLPLSASSPPLLTYYRGEAERWQAEAKAQAERAARLQETLYKVLRMIAEGDGVQAGDALTEGMIDE